MNEEKPTTYSVALVIYNKDRSKYLIVKRPDDDKDMAGHWGFPATSKRYPEQDWEEVVHLAAKNKLGVKVKIIEEIGEDSIDRGNFILVLRDYEVEVIEGEPSVPQDSDPDHTQYEKLEWTDNPEKLKKSAKEGSLCSRIFLRANNISWQ